MITRICGFLSETELRVPCFTFIESWLQTAWLKPAESGHCTSVKRTVEREYATHGNHVIRFDYIGIRKVQ